ERARGGARSLRVRVTAQMGGGAPRGAGGRWGEGGRGTRGRGGAAGLLLVALLIGMAGTTWGMMRAERAREDAVSAQLAEAERAEGERRAREEAQKRLAQIERGTEVLASVFRDVDPKAEQKEGGTVRVLLGRRLSEAARQV